jgi:putative transposase
MLDYRRNRVPGGTSFFTVNLLDRRSNLLVARIDALRDAVRQVRARALFHIDAWVVLPDHMHCLWIPASSGDGGMRSALPPYACWTQPTTVTGRGWFRRQEQVFCCHS